MPCYLNVLMHLMVIICSLLFFCKLRWACRGCCNRWLNMLYSTCMHIYFIFIFYTWTVRTNISCLFWLIVCNVTVLLINYLIDRRLSICAIVICVICVIASSKAPSKVLFLSLYCIRLSVNSLLFVCFICQQTCVCPCMFSRPSVWSFVSLAHYLFCVLSIRLITCTLDYLIGGIIYVVWY